MGVDELSAPLGLDRPAKTASRRRIPIGPVALTLALLITVSALAVVLSTRDPLGGEPVVVSAISKEAPAPAIAAAPAEAREQAKVVAASPRSTAAEIEEASGVKVVRQSGSAPSAVIIRVPEAAGAAQLAAAPDKRIVEKGRHGLLPKVSADGQRPLDIYARPVAAAAKTRSARIVIIVGGLGIGQNVTAEAIAKLPADIDLAFAPYGSDLERQVQTARKAGHEVLLQLPMEPFDYPDNDPGPQTLLSTSTPDQNVDRLQWLMSRFSGYVGVTNYMGARLSANEEAFAPVLKEIAARGLAYLDDGSAPKSRAVALASGGGLPVQRGDVTIDLVQRGADIDLALAKLETIAREKGVAIGIASALPVTIEHLARWSKTLEGRGIALLPFSAAVALPKT